MKKNFTLFFIYASIIIAGLCLFLIFHNKKEDTPPTNNPQQEQPNNKDNENTDNSGGGTSEEDEEDNVIYATKLTLNCARAIDIATNSSVEIIGSYLTLEPANANLTITITTESGKQNDLTFSNNVITTQSAGKYRIRFSALKSSTSELSDTLVVNVKENVTSLITTKLSVLTIEDNKNLIDIFNFDSSITNTEIQTDSKLTYLNSCFAATELGVSIIRILYDVGMFRFLYTASITIKDKPLYTIEITDVSSSAIVNANTIEYSCKIGKSLEIFYAVKNRDEEYVDQFVEISLDNSNVASYVLTEPKIKVTCLSKGSVNLTITCANDKESKLTVTINFI